MKRMIVWPVIVVLIAGCHSGPVQHTVKVKAAIDGLDAGELIYYAPMSDLSNPLTVTSEAGQFSFEAPIAPGKGDWYKVWIGGTPTPDRVLQVYLDEGDMELSASGGGFSHVRYSGSPAADEMEEVTALVARAGKAASDTVENPAVVALEHWIASHPDSRLGTALLDQGRGGAMAADTVVAYFARRGTAALNNMPAVHLRDWIKETADVLPGKPAPEFTMPDTAGRVVSLKDLRGRYVLVDFWASWCGPCRAENPNVVRVYQQYKDKGFTVLGVSLDRAGDKESWMAAIHHDGLYWTQVSDLQFWQNAAVKLYKVKGVPANFLVDPQGVIVARNLRGGDLGRRIKKLVEDEPPVGVRILK